MRSRLSSSHATFPREHEPCPIGSDRALDNALITAPKARDPELLKKLAAVAGARRATRKIHVGLRRTLPGILGGDIIMRHDHKARQAINSRPFQAHFANRHYYMDARQLYGHAS
jgi:hypothetical protein